MKFTTLPEPTVTTCKGCQELKPCNKVIDPYVAELYGYEVEVLLCDDCYESAMFDV
jgi:hypothetical protein